MSYRFRLVFQEGGGSRLGNISTSHGSVETPAFMPVATKGYVKTLTPEDVLKVKTQAIIANAFHLYLRPGADFIENIGGIHRFTGIPLTTFTDSGGFQIIRKDFSFKVVEEGIIFVHPSSGEKVLFNAELCADIQRRMGVDVAMALDFCAPYPSNGLDNLSYKYTVRWARMFRESYERAAFGIVQGGFDEKYREICAKEMAEIDFEGYAIGGLCIGEPKEITFRILRNVIKFLPEEKVRYLMGVGSPADIVRAVELGVDLFDSAYPTRNARHGTLLTWHGKMNIKRSEFRSDTKPIDEDCCCYTCRNFSRSYLHHLFKDDDMGVKRLLTIHNLHFINEFFEKMREAIKNGEFAEFKKRILDIYG